MFNWFRKPKAAAAKPDRSALVPRIKTRQFTAFAKDLVNDMGKPGENLPYTEPLAADLIVAYAFHLPGLFQMASVGAIAELGIALPEVRGIALANLQRQLPRIGFSEHGAVGRIVTGENLEACTLLAGPFWDQVASETDGEVVVAVPNRDIVLFCGSRSAEGLATLREVSSGVLAEEDTHNLTRHLLVWRGGSWVEYEGQ